MNPATRTPETEPSTASRSEQGKASDAAVATVPEPLAETGGRRDGTNPTRFGDWEKGGRCIDF